MQYTLETYNLLIKGVEKACVVAYEELKKESENMADLSKKIGVLCQGIGFEHRGIAIVASEVMKKELEKDMRRIILDNSPQSD